MQQGGIQGYFGSAAKPLVWKYRWLLVLVLALIVLVSYGQTVHMYFWQDDAALMFKAQHPIENSGAFGPGYFGVFPYKYIATPFIPLYPLFHLNPAPYFAIGVGIYLLLTLMVYWFVRVLTQRNSVAAGAAVLFAGGYFAQMAIFRIITSYQSTVGVLLSIAAFGAYVLYHLTKRWPWYLMAVVFFGATIEIVLVRSHGLILPVLAIELLYWVPQKTWRDRLTQLAWALVRLLPLGAIYYHYYLVPTNSSSSGVFSSLWQTYAVQGKWEYWLGTVASFGNVIVPDATIAWFQGVASQTVGSFTAAELWVVTIFLVLVIATWKRLRLHWAFVVLALVLGTGWLLETLVAVRAAYPWYTDSATQLAGLIGGLAIIYSVLIGLFIRKRSLLLGSALLFSVVWIVAGYIGYFVLYPTSIMTSTSRYVMHSYVGTVVIWAVIVELLLHGLAQAKEPKKAQSFSWLPGAVVIGALLAVPLSLSVNTQQAWVTNISNPTRAFYQRMLALHPTLAPHAIVWYDATRDPTVQYQLGNFFAVGSMPNETALAIYYGIDRYDLKLAGDSNEFLRDAVVDKASINQLYSLFFDGKSLNDTTDHTRSALQGELQPIAVAVTNGTTLTPTGTVGASTPMALNATIQATVKPASELTATGAFPGKLADLKTYFDYLSAREAARKQWVVSASSEWSGSEKEHLIDNDSATGWQAHRTLWLAEHHAFVQVELPQATNVARVMWVNGAANRAPADYTIQTSTNGTNWQVVKTVTKKGQVASGATMAEDFDSVSAKFVRMDITGTAAEEPGMVEFEAVPTVYSRLDPQVAAQLFADPLLGAQDAASKQLVAAYLANHSVVTATYQTDAAGAAKNDTITVPLTGNGNYQVLLPASGTKLESIVLKVPTYLANVTVSNASISFPSLQSLQDLGFITRRSVN